MAFYSSASNNSTWRGADYYEKGKVKSSYKVGISCFEGEVEGSDDQIYSVYIDIDHPRKSTCSCPFAEGRRVVCKHMVALYFASISGSLEAFREDITALEARYELEEKCWREEMLASIKRQVKSMSAKEAKDKLIDILYQDALDDRYQDDYW
ncbi:MAG: SWIM zinc finger family protein [Eggerthellaceae bacterium]|nr:SWIM zinc finger family protein [Eggerthellaceae bacterium]